MESTFRKPAENRYPQKIFAHQLITVDDLFQFKKELVQELLTALKSQPNSTPKKWMKSHEVRRLLKVSPGTLQTLKSSGILPSLRWAASDLVYVDANIAVNKVRFLIPIVNVAAKLCFQQVAVPPTLIGWYEVNVSDFEL